ncbi:MAG: DEAD/DEAH box helicase family protein [Lachnospiraceae bacterium]|nr:DEAD/DEAH box helicase family protein [Lachnospiraceae bacterium]
MLPEELARIKIDKQLNHAGWDIVSRNEYVPNNSSAVKEALMQGNTESDYLLFVDDKAIAVVEAKKESNDLGEVVAQQAESYSIHPQNWYGLWFAHQIPLVYLANGNKIYFKNMLEPDSDYVEISEMHSPKKMLQLIKKESEYGALPRIEKAGLRDCQYDAEINLEASLKAGKKKALSILATGSGKTYLACLASYRLLNYTHTNRVLFLVDRNNLAKQTETEFTQFTRTENGKALSDLYRINRLKHKEDIDGDVVISTIQKLFAILTGSALPDESNDDKEDEILSSIEEDESTTPIDLGKDLKLSPDHFQFIVIDECHRSIYGKWKVVLDYFKDAKILGLTATPTEEAYAFFNKNIIEEYTYDDSVVDGVNVPARVYRITTDVTEHGGTIKAGDMVREQSKRDGNIHEFILTDNSVEYGSNQLDRSVINPSQIAKVLITYRDAVYTDLYEDRNESWEYVPKTLIFAKNDNHASQIVEIAKQVFAEKFSSGKVPDNFVKKITYSAGDSDALIRELRNEKEFRIAATVTLVATGTDIRPLEVVLFMNDVKSEILYTQMKGRGCRVILDDKLREVTPNANTKNCFYIVDAVGVTEHDKTMPKPVPGTNPKKRVPNLETLLEYLAHGAVSDDNLALLRDYCASIHRRYEDNPVLGRHLTQFIEDYHFAPRTLANTINTALSQETLPPYNSPSEDNSARKNMLFCLIGNIQARKELLTMQAGYFVISDSTKDELLYKGFSKESARKFIDSFEKCLEDNKDSIEALRIIYNSEDVVITHDMLQTLQDKLMAANRLFIPYEIWRNYKIIDTDGYVEKLGKQNMTALTNLIQLVRYAFKKNTDLVSLYTGYSQRFSLYCGRNNHKFDLTENQREIMKQIADYIISDGAITTADLNQNDPDLWRKAITSFGAPLLATEMQTLSKYILRVA